jgi:hypothetical protein
MKHKTTVLTLLGLAWLASGCGRTHVVGGEYPDEICDNRFDDDRDGRTDCDDDDCTGHPSCQQPDEICQNEIDDDGDGLVDCDDPDCARDRACIVPGREDCDNRRDDDEDGLIDCDDPDCAGDPRCSTAHEICNNRRDDDRDRLVDCDDPDCFGHPACREPGEEICNNEIDDDEDGLADCDDPDCFGLPICLPGQEICDNRRDDDGDGAVDCNDPDCFFDPACQNTPELCFNGRDDDGDFLVDCDDPDCALDPGCQPGAELCENNRDDDGDRLVDCDDPDCFKHPACREPGEEVCNNGIDDDDDQLVDCDDDDCFGLPICQPGQEVCDNNRDDDGDGAVDCDDPDCADFPACQTIRCSPTADFGLLQAKGSSVTRTLQTSGTSDVYTSRCVVPGGGEVVAHFALAAASDVKLTYEQLSGDHAFSIFVAGVGEACNANPRDCFDPESQKSGSFTISALEPGDYYLFAEAFAQGLEGSVRVTLSTGSVQTPENCGNGVDDDGDGAVDCADLDCALAPICATQICQYDVNLGSLVVNGPSKTTTVNTIGGGDEIAARCAAGGGADRVVRLVMPEAAGLAVDVQQQGWHTLGLHRNQGPGTTCTADAGSCFDTNQEPAFRLSYGTVEKGVYYYVIDALQPGMEGEVTLSFRAFANRGPELCANEIDDDGDGLVDCKDPDCTGVVGCPGPVCSPDENVGALVPEGPTAQVQAVTSNNNNDQTVPCALGGGKDVVIELQLTEVSGLAISCTQTGDHVLGLFVAGGPRAPCDETPTNCADLKTGPFGCDFIFPNLQPGSYYMVVEAFRPGAEGTVDLFLAAVPDHAQEICNNNVDDDGDGKVDCQDSNCSTEPICQGQTCTPEQKLGVLPVGGAAKDVALTTSGAGDSNSAGCALGGGEDAVVSFRLPQQATLEIDFAQLGNHVFALFDDRGVGYACDAAPLACQTSDGQVSGQVVFASLQPGDYHLVVEAVASGGEGSVVMQLAAK